MLAALVAGMCPALHARDLYVDPKLGSDAANGLAPGGKDGAGPLKSIARAVGVAQPGDTIHLAQTVYTEQIGFYGAKSGETGKPITVDGHGATIKGSVPLDPKDWKEVAPGLYAGESAEFFKPYMRPKDLQNAEWADACVGRFSFIFDGKLNRMNHSVKAPAVPWKAPVDLKPGEWTYEPPPNKLFGRYYVKIDPAKKLADCQIEMPVMVSGVQVDGTISHLVFRNITVTHVVNDGFALTPGNEPGSVVRDIVYRNIRSVECCDDGLSAHADCEVDVDGFEVDDCSTGIASSGTSVNRHLVLRNIHGKDLVFGGGRHVIEDSRIMAHGRSAAVQVWSVWYTNIAALATTALKLDNVLLSGAPDDRAASNQIQVGDRRSSVELAHCTVAGLSVLIRDGANVKVSDCVIAGGSIDIDAKSNWQAQRNLYDVDRLVLGAAAYPAANFEAYRKATGQDAASRWMKLEPARLGEGRQRLEIGGAAVGADPARLPAVEQQP